MKTPCRFLRGVFCCITILADMGCSQNTDFFVAGYIGACGDVPGWDVLLSRWCLQDTFL